MLKKADLMNEHILYEYFTGISEIIPFYFPVNFDLWHKCMFNDCTDDGKPLFDELETYLYYENDTVKGFIQFGVSSFTFNENGMDFSSHYAIIRNMHYSQDSKNPNEMIEKAFEYFNGKNMKEIDAFFHYFGMSCYARHGKLHESAFYIEKLLYSYSFIKEHENVYFSKDLSNFSYVDDSEIACQIQNMESNKQKIIFFINNDQIGYCEISFLENSICYLHYLEINKELRSKGIGTRCMNNLFSLLVKKNIQKVDLDTIDTNTRAQTFYVKIGFINKGITRSYYREN
jgi:ribosomal protein S18 acetylase RimI-like enzyme